MNLRSKVAVAVGAAAIGLGSVMASVSYADDGPWLPGENDSFRAYNAGVGQYLDSNGSGNNVITYPRSDSQQVWHKFAPQGNTFGLTSEGKAGQCITAPHTLGRPATMQDCDDRNPLQRFVMVIEGDRTLIARAGDTGEVLTATGKSSSGNLKNVTLDTKRTPNLNQRWYIGEA
ncbi:ricin-type beta-trefoil lectin domain protein [Streptomyces sp. NPDC006743]|uniref:ricin-type beta-trefoil lectin domain protein n=1 Tax=Streptomyces sp. NPDC006743 TaxID=3154480 RepID=UPI0034547787